MRKSNLEKLREAKKGTTKTVTINGDLVGGLARMLLGGDFNPTQQRFMYSGDRIKAYKGPAGCAKTSTLAAAGLLRALFQPGSKGFVSRADYNDLMDTTKLRMEEMLQRLPKGTLIDRDKSPPEKWWIQPVGGLPSDEPSQITFMGLSDDIVGVEANWWIIDEANEVEENRMHQINARLRAKGGDYMMGMAFNPPDKHHWLYTACTGLDSQDRRLQGKEPWITLYEPQPRENAHNLPENYYENLAKTLPEDQRQRFVDGEWGGTFDGAPVYREFKAKLHVRDDLRTTQFDPSATLFRFWDFGYNHPCCIWAQVDYEGRLLVFRELMGDMEEAIPFAAKVAGITASQFAGAKDIIDFGDPAVKQKKDTGQTLALLARAGIKIRYRHSTIEFGVQLIRQRLQLLIGGEPAVQFDRRGCPILISAMRGGYHLDKHGQKPFKDNVYDHLADAFRYGVINLFGAAGSNVTLSEALIQSLAYQSEFDPF